MPGPAGPALDCPPIGALAVTLLLGVAMRFSWVAGVLATPAAVGVLGDLIARRPGMFVGLTLRSSVAATIDVTFRVNGAPTTIAGIVLPAGVATSVAFGVAFPLDAIINLDVAAVLAVTTDLQATTEIVWS